MFEHSLLATQTKVRSKFRALFFPIALGVHALVAGGVVVGQYWNVEPVAEPPIQVSFLSALPPPPPECAL